MKTKRKEQTDNNEPILSEGERFLKELREMPYDNSMVGKSFIVVRFKPTPKTNKSMEGNEQAET